MNQIRSVNFTKEYIIEIIWDNVVFPGKSKKSVGDKTNKYERKTKGN